MDYYQILGIAKNASSDDIKKKYKELAIKFHPDKNPSGESNNQFQKINEAYKTLSDPYERGKYDELLDKGSYNQINDIFGMSFNNAMYMFNNIFQNNNFFNNEFNFPSFNLPSFNLNNFGNESNYSIYSSNIIQSVGQDGKINTKEHISVNNNGKQENYINEYFIDEKGKKHIIKEDRNQNLLGSGQKKNRAKSFKIKKMKN